MDAELTGRRLGVYQLHERIGAGGMGEVYRARDTRLQRDVAVKILPHTFTADSDRRARFEREARVLASLNHPNIATIHGVEDADGIHALVMELVEGETIADRLGRGPVPVPDALAMARQIADALDTAHERGIVHRDLKPANIKVTSSGLVKVLDFGLAKAVAGDDTEPDAHASTVTAFATQEGLVVGTPAYMSPEQMRGQSVDKRTDIWAFGCVLYELITGRAAFARQTISDTIAAILDRDPDWESVHAIAPATVWSLVRRCLVKDPKRRLRDIGDVRIQIDEILAGSGGRHRRVVLDAGRTAVEPRLDPYGCRARNHSADRRWTCGLPQLAHDACGDSCTVHAVLRRPDADLAVRPCHRLRPTAVTSSSSARRKSCDVALDSGVDSAASRSIPGTEGAQTPIWSPDGAWIGFFADGRLKKVAVDGGQPQTIAALPGFQDASWGSGGSSSFARAIGSRCSASRNRVASPRHSRS